jgi:hypothetical protein
MYSCLCGEGSRCSIKFPQAATLAVVFLVTGIAPCAAGQPANEAPRIEVWGSLSTAFAGSPGTLTSSYSPPAPGLSVVSNTAAQTLTIDGNTSLGFQGGVNVFLVPHAGLQIIVDRISTSVSGRNTPYDTALVYLQSVTPQSPPITHTVENSVPWPDTTGSLTQWTTALNGVARVGPHGRVSATLSGGLSYYRLSGTVQPLAYTVYGVEPHIGRDIVFSELWHLGLALDPTNALGVNAGGDVNIAVRKHGAVMIGYRYLGGASLELPTRVETISYTAQVPPRGMTPVASGLLTPPVKGVSPSGSRFVVGLKWMP